MGRRDPSYRILNHLMNFALDTVEKRMSQNAQQNTQNTNSRYLPIVRKPQPANSQALSSYNEVNNLVKIEKSDVYFDRDIGGLMEAKEALRLSVVYPRVRRDLYSLYEKPLGNVLLYGPPGCGKTLLAKAVSNECGWMFIYPHMGRSKERRVGKECRSRWSPYH